MIKSKTVRIVVIIIPILVSLALIEVIVRNVLPRPGFKSFHHIHVTHSAQIPHPTRGYVLAPNFIGRHTTKDYDITLKTNALGFRDLPISINETIDVLAVGDSYTFGWGVEAKEAWPSQLQSWLNSSQVLTRPTRILNTGVSGYSLTQIRVSTEELLQQMSPKLIILGLYLRGYWRIDDPHISINGRLVRKSKIKHMKFLESGTLYSRFKKNSLRSADFWLKENYYFGAHLLDTSSVLLKKIKKKIKPPSKPNRMKTEELLRPLLHELELLYKLSMAKDIMLVVLLVNEQQEDSTFSPKEKMYNSIVKSFCKSLGIEVFDPIPAFEELSDGTPKLRVGNDHHWSKQAHKVAAQNLAHFLIQRKEFLVRMRKPSLNPGPKSFLFPHLFDQLNPQNPLVQLAKAIP